MFGLAKTRRSRVLWCKDNAPHARCSMGEDTLTKAATSSLKIAAGALSRGRDDGASVGPRIELWANLIKDE